jgi:23S rRNA (uracil1939-C5)-methyltransferase
MKIEIVTIEKLIFGGQGLARLEDGQIVFVWNALPGEEVKIEIEGKKKGVLSGKVVEMIKPSPQRVESKEKHFLSSSPWGMMDIDMEHDWKIKMAQETYEKIGKISFEEPLEIVKSDSEYEYRNKIEFCFTKDENDEIQLAFFERGKKEKIIVDDSKLAEPIINEIAQRVLAWIRTTKMTTRNLKSLIVRSNGKGEGISALFIKDELKFKDSPMLDENFLGFQLYFSTYRSPASVPTKLLKSYGKDYLIANLGKVEMKFGLLSFFQINIPIFEKVIDVIGKNIGDEKQILDFYSGVGSIGLAVGKQEQSIELVDSNVEGIEYAKENIALNDFKKASAICSTAEKITELITKEKVLIVDPPRAGLHKNVTERILEVLPEKIVYMSCNISTHARDIELLSGKYKITYLKLYNFFPRTPHIESLCVLELKK